MNMAQELFDQGGGWVGCGETNNILVELTTAEKVVHDKDIDVS